MNAIIGILIGNTLFTLLFYLFYLKKRNMKYCSLFFLFFPVFGLLLYAVYRLTMFFLKKHNSEWGYLNHRYQFEKSEDIPDVSKELDIIPVRDAMAISRTKEKRTLILEQLKKGIDNNYKYVMDAGSDTDSESAHYVASAKMEVYRELKEKLKHATQEYEYNDEEGFPAMEESLAEFIESDLLAKNEKRSSIKKYLSLIREAGDNKELLWNEEILERFLTFALLVQDYEAMKGFWDLQPKERKTETSYLRMLEMYYEMQNKEGFYQMLDEMCTSSQVLSSEGIQVVRFWAKGRD